MGKIIHRQRKQWHTAVKGAVVGSTFTPLLVSNQKSYDHLLESDFVMVIEEGKGGPPPFCAPGHNVSLLLMVIITQDDSTVMSLKHRQPCLWCNSKPFKAMVARCPCMVLIFLFLQPRGMHLLFKGAFHTFMLHHYLLQVKAQKCWPGKCSQSDMAECVSLKCVSQLSHFLLGVESAKQLSGAEL